MIVDEHITALKERWKSPLCYDGQERDRALVREIDWLRTALQAIADGDAGNNPTWFARSMLKTRR